MPVIKNIEASMAKAEGFPPQLTFDALLGSRKNRKPDPGKLGLRAAAAWLSSNSY